MIRLILMVIVFLPIFAHAAAAKEITLGQFEKELASNPCASFIYIFTSWCPVCEASYDNVKLLHLRYNKPDKIKFIGLSLDQSPERLSEFIEKHEVSFPIYRLNYSDARAVKTTFEKLGIGFGGRVPHATLRDCEGNIFADGSFNYPYYDTVLKYWQNNYLK